MSKRKNGLGLMVAVAALGMMAFASSAQALTPEFFVNGTLYSSGLDVKVGGVQEEAGTLLIPTLNTEIKCNEVEVSGGLLTNSTSAKVEKLLFKVCSVLHAGVVDPNCHVSDVHTGNPSLLHITALNVPIKPIEFHPEGKPEDKDFGLLFGPFSVFINMLSGLGCTLPLKTEVKGSVCALIEPATNHKIRPLLLFSQAIQELAGCKDSMLFGAQASYIDSKVELFPTSTGHTTATLGVLLA